MLALRIVPLTKKLLPQRALKCIKLPAERYDFSAYISIREIQILAGLTQHTNIVRLHDVVCHPRRGECYLVLEYVHGGTVQGLIHEFRENPSKRTDRLIAYTFPFILRGALQGLQHMHTHGFFHRDIKPSNLLLSDQGVCKIGDCLLARRCQYSGPHASPLTLYVSMRWYRAPELLLEAPVYGAPVDIFALACVAAELYHPQGNVLFRGTSQADQVYRVFRVIGTPTETNWPEGADLMKRHKLECNVFPENLRATLPTEMDDTTVDWLRHCLALDPQRRLTADEALSHAIFHQSPPRPAVDDEEEPSLGVENPPQAPSHQRKLLRNPYTKMGRHRRSQPPQRKR